MAEGSDSLLVILAIFSGRCDPEWSVPPSHPKFAEIKQLLDDAKSDHFTYSPERMPARLGYKGFLVKATKRAKMELIVGPETANLQRLLLETATDDVLPQGNKDGVLEEINAGNVKPEQVTTCHLGCILCGRCWKGKRKRGPKLSFIRVVKSSQLLVKNTTFFVISAGYSAGLFFRRDGLFPTSAAYSNTTVGYFETL